ncbi:GNAT family N-acetyltransferase [Yoonia sp. F2084L]|uniref:GNAT family N-acetyltransferase n=1 Tax=Yoonia sp. F2084L TaxID=2926419 RepID=UPI001FF582D7|nr:GNAT family N-acetyltransferase [Yoonia sp. F2084L]
MTQIRPYDPTLAQDFLALNRAVLVHYDIAPATSAEEARLIGLLDQGRYLSCEIAYVDEIPAGFATWALVFPAGAGMALFMKELFVAPAFQGQRVGRAMMAHLTQIAINEGCKRIDWQTDGDNTGARAFYASIDAPVVDKVSYRVTASDYDRFLNHGTSKS